MQVAVFVSKMIKDDFKPVGLFSKNPTFEILIVAILRPYRAAISRRETVRRVCWDRSCLS